MIYNLNSLITTNQIKYNYRSFKSTLKHKKFQHWDDTVQLLQKENE